MPAPKVRCPQCHTLNDYSATNRWRPFCSERCKIIDLGAWATDAYSIPGKAVEGNDSIDELLLDSEQNDSAGNQQNPYQH